MRRKWMGDKAGSMDKGKNETQWSYMEKGINTVYMKVTGSREDNRGP